MNNPKNYYIILPDSVSAQAWINTEKKAGKIKNTGLGTVISPVFDPASDDLELAFRFEYEESKWNKNKIVLQAMGARGYESAEAYRKKYPQDKNPNTNGNI